jgi:predicted DNA-binding transcriptional regulator
MDRDKLTNSNSSANASSSKLKGREDTMLKGTTFRVYKLLYTEGRPLGIHDIQKALGLSSPSVSQYHVKKLVSAGLVREQESEKGTGYIVDKVVFENIIRIRSSVMSPPR